MSSCQSSASVASTSSTLSSALIFVDMSPVISETVKSPRTAKGAGLITTARGVGTTDIEVEVTGPSKSTWGRVSDTVLVGGWFKLENAKFPNIDDVLKILGVETNPVKEDVATGGAVGAGAVEGEGCEVKLDDNQPSELGLSGVGGETCWSSVASSCQSSGSNSSVSSTPLSSALLFVDMPLMISDSSRMAKGVELIAATGVGTIDIEVGTVRPPKPT